MDNIESIYELSPLQEGMLFQCLAEPGSGAYLVQVRLDLQGELKERAFADAWQQVTDRHPVLRTGFFWEGTDKPLQVVFADAEVTLETLDWRGMSQAEVEAAWERLVAEDRKREFVLGEPSLMRLTLVRCGETEHRVLWTSHHLLMDGWALHVVQKDFFAAYEAACDGRLPEWGPSVPFQEYIVWLQEQDAAQAERFWREHLAGLSAPTPLGIGGGHKGAEAARAPFGEVKHRLDRELTQALTERARRAQVTLNTLVQGAWALLLSRYSGEDDVLFGTVAAGRSADLFGVEEMVGLLINTLPVRVRVPDNQTVVRWLQEMQALQAELRQYEHSSLTEIQGWSGLEPGVRMFDTLFVFENYAVDEEAFGSGKHLKLTGNMAYEQTDYAVSLVVLPGEELSFKAMYDGRQVQEDAILLMMGHLETVLRELTVRETLGEISMLTERERHQVLTAWNDTAAEYPRVSMQEEFERQAAQTPDAAALKVGEETMSYRELNAAANRMARHLQERGVQPGDRVGVCLHRSFDLIVSLLAILKAGGAYVPLDPSYPADRLAFMIEDADLCVLVAHRPLLERLPTNGAAVVLPVEEREAIMAHSDAPLGIAGSSEACVYVNYTSGSTGRPKGVLTPHRGVMRLVKGNDFADMGAQDVFLQLAPVSFDAATLEIWGALLNGGCLVLYPAEGVTLEGIGEAVRSNGVTVLWLTAGLFHQMVEQRPQDLAGVRQLLAGGDVLSAAHVREMLSWMQPGAKLINGYGPTEGTTFTACYAMSEAAEVGSNVSIGRPIRNTQVYVLDARLQPVPIGVAGELYIGGDGLALGYLNRPDLTEQAFLPHPFSAKPGARVYKTGDRVRWLPDGRLEFVGRLDNQVKIRGFRIEPGEVETVLHQLPAIQEAVVLPLADPKGEKRLVAYVVTEEANITVQQVREEIKAQLPAHLVPSLYVLLPEMPLSPNGKVDRRSLPAPDWSGAADLPFVAPRDELEETVAAIWADALGLERVGITQNFFDLGGHSLIITRIVSRLREALEADVPLGVVFEAPTVEELANQLRKLTGEEHRAIEGHIERRSETGAHPLSSAQQRLWFLDQMDTGRALYNIGWNLEIEGPLDEALWQRCLQEIVRRHAVLRTTFRFTDGQAVQVVAAAKEVSFTVPVIDLQTKGAAEQAADIERLTQEEICRPFALERDLPVRCTLLRLGRERHRSLLTLHHIAGDGWSVGVLARELQELYRAYSAQEQPDLPALDIQYADYAAWQREQLNRTALAEQLEYWKAQLEDAPAQLELPLDAARPAVRQGKGAALVLPLSETLVERLRDIGRAENASLYMTLLAAFQVLLMRITGQEDIVVGTTASGRGQSQTEPLIGLFVNTLVLRSRMQDAPDFRSFLRRVRDTALEAQQHSDVPFDTVVEALRPDRAASGNPLFDVMFTYFEHGDSNMQAGPLTWQVVDEDNPVARFDLTLYIDGIDGKYQARFEYDADLFRPDTIERLASHFRTLLDGIAAEAGTSLLELPLLSPCERDQLLFDWNNQAAPYPQVSIQAQFEAQADRTPDRTALVFQGDRLSYRELDQEANRLARYLQERGVQRGDRVGVCLERSFELIVSVLAIVKAGAAYVPLDPSYPADRLAFMIDDAKLGVLIAQERLLDNVPANAVRTVLIEAEREAIGEMSTERIGIDNAPDDCAYVNYTSGSTGRPKGVLTPHRGVLRLVKNNGFLEVEEQDVFLQLAPVSFDAATLEIWGSLLNGAQLVLYPHPHADLDEIGNVVKESGVTTLWLTAGLFHQMADHRPQDVAGVRHLLAGGDVLSAPHVKKVLSLMQPGSCLINGYGPTESTTFAACHVMTDADEVGANVPIGRPINKTALYVLDARLQPVPIGVTGELYIGGDGLALGYLNRPDLTEQAFLPHPFQQDARIYKTGDAVRWLPDGRLEFVGRLDQQVKIRGYRIEAGEIEAAVRELPSVAEAVVIVREDAPGDKRMTAYVVLEQPGAAAEADSLKEQLKERLPSYMVPSAVVLLDRLPLTANGKVDRRALPKPELSAQTVHTEPRSQLEKVLTTVFAELLALPAVSIHDDFFDLGGHSLLATQAVAHLREMLRIELPLRMLFDHPTAAKLAAALSADPPQAARLEKVASLLVRMLEMSEEEVEGSLSSKS